MRAHLARHVLRLNSISSGVALARRPTLQPRGPAALALARPRIFRRTFIGFLKNPPRQIKPRIVEPGWATIQAWERALRDNIRPPTPRTLRSALRNFFHHKHKHMLPLNSRQVVLCKNLIVSLQQSRQNEKKGLSELSEYQADMQAAQKALLIAPKNDELIHHGKLASILYQQMREVRVAIHEEKQKSNAVTHKWLAASLKESNEDFEDYIINLTQYGKSTGAANAVRDHSVDVWHRKEGRDDTDPALWSYVLRGLAREGREEDLCEYVEVAKSRGCQAEEIQEIMTSFYASRCSLDPKDTTALEENMKKTESWFFLPLSSPEKTPNAATYQTMLDLGSEP